MLKDFLKSFATAYAISYLATIALENTQAKKAELKKQKTGEEEIRDELYRLGDSIDKAFSAQNK